MVDTSRIVPNFLFMSAAQAFGFLCGLGTTVLLARFLGPASYGVLGFGQAFVGFAMMLVVMGTDRFGAREIARDGAGAPRLVSEILGVRTLLVAVAFPIAVGLAYAVGIPDRTANVIVIQAFGMLVAVIGLDYAFQGLQRMGMIAIRQSVAALLVLAGTATLVRAPDDVYIAALLPVAAVAVTSLWLLMRLRALFGSFAISFKRAAWKRIMSASIPIGLGGFSVLVFQYSDVLMLGFQVPEADVGRYVAMGRLYIIIVAAGDLLAAAFSPVLSQMVGADAATKRLRFRQFVIGILVFGGPPAAAIAVFPGETLSFFFGAGYVMDKGVLTIIMASALVFLMAIATSAVMIAWNEERFHLKALAGSAVLNAALNAVLIPLWGLRGAAVATLVGVTCLVAVELARLSRRDDVVDYSALLHCFALLALSFGAAFLARSLLDIPLLDRYPAIVLFGFGGAAYCVFVAVAAATGLIRPAQVLRLVFRRAAA